MYTFDWYFLRWSNFGVIPSTLTQQMIKYTKYIYTVLFYINTIFNSKVTYAYKKVLYILTFMSNSYFFFDNVNIAMYTLLIRYRFYIVNIAYISLPLTSTTLSTSQNWRYWTDIDFTSLTWPIFFLTFTSSTLQHRRCWIDIEITSSTLPIFLKR